MIYKEKITPVKLERKIVTTARALFAENKYL